ncbi:hypothetical protein CR194_18880 [Salipaludibacillus keqinensis]|uniref:Uncharacterized protein n=1 Tax=Salipaludibacillus keqinensis TaxID=2045207 RepID=A0A323T5D4_9BACI|nr:DUF6069 family protein [Salipaludibacillus keqinensis]PYZ91692.1 hypothetical protein CR194_18880 [Salipaludibacillus keqinensis]
MYEQRFSRYVIGGVITAIVAAALAVFTFLIFSFISGYEVKFIGSNQDTLYVGVIIGASVVSILLGAVLFYAFNRWTKKPIVWFGVLVLIAFIGNTVMAENDLQAQFKLVAHTIHVIVALSAFLLIPKLTKKSKARNILK